jgi:hypothetical protein
VGVKISICLTHTQANQRMDYRRRAVGEQLFWIDSAKRVGREVEENVP